MAKTIEYYQGSDRPIQVTYPATNERIAYGYDAAGRMTWAGYVDWGTYETRPLATLDYSSETGRLTKRTSFDYDTGLKHVEETYEYQLNGAVTRQVWQGFDTSGVARDAIAWTYEYDKTMNVTRIADGAGAYTYLYDALNRLTSESYASGGSAKDYSRQYWYDAAGNRTKLAKNGGAETLYYYDDNYRLTKSVEGGADTVWQWDAAGNLTRRAIAGGDTWEYLWDARDKMTKVRKQPFGGAMADVCSYTYDALGRRFQKIASGATTTYYQDGLTPVVEAKAGLTKRHRAFEGDLGNVVQTVDGTNNTFYAYDARLGNVIATFGTDGKLKQNYNAYGMDAFGNVYAGNPENFGITTKQLDTDTGLYYFNARWYDSYCGQFISSSPLPKIVEQDYDFTEDNPIRRLDINGYTSVMVLPIDGLNLDRYAYCEAKCAQSNPFPDTPMTKHERNAWELAYDGWPGVIIVNVLGAGLEFIQGSWRSAWGKPFINNKPGTSGGFQFGDMDGNRRGAQEGKCARDRYGECMDDCLSGDAA